jgi:UDP-glucose 4-epimerase
MEMLSAFEKAVGGPIPCRICARRPGDITSIYADPSAANKDLGWKALRGIDEMARDAWNWQKRNPNGYD